MTESNNVSPSAHKSFTLTASFATDYIFDYFTALQTKETEDDAMLGKNKKGRCVPVRHSNRRKLLSNHN